jgi:hypothetical protein
MSDLHEARDPERKSQIDTVGWLFLAFALASVTAAAAIPHPQRICGRRASGYTEKRHLLRALLTLGFLLFPNNLNASSSMKLSSSAIEGTKKHACRKPY